MVSNHPWSRVILLAIPVWNLFGKWQHQLSDQAHLHPCCRRASRRVPHPLPPGLNPRLSGAHPRSPESSHLSHFTLPLSKRLQLQPWRMHPGTSGWRPGTSRMRPEPSRMRPGSLVFAPFSKKTAILPKKQGLCSSQTFQVGTARCAVPVAERSVRRRKNEPLPHSFRPAGRDAAARHPYHLKSLSKT
jgi:hypothetical protein